MHFAFYSAYGMRMRKYSLTPAFVSSQRLGAGAKAGAPFLPQRRCCVWNSNDREEMVCSH